MTKITLAFFEEYDYILKTRLKTPQCSIFFMNWRIATVPKCIRALLWNSNKIIVQIYKNEVNLIAGRLWFIQVFSTASSCSLLSSWSFIEFQTVPSSTFARVFWVLARVIRGFLGFFELEFSQVWGLKFVVLTFYRVWVSLSFKLSASNCTKLNFSLSISSFGSSNTRFFRFFRARV